MPTSPPAAQELGRQLAELGWVEDLFVGGSAATGDYTPGVSDLDLVALVAGPVSAARREQLVAVHRGLDTGAARGLNLGCSYVNSELVLDFDRRHPTWTHGRLTRRRLSGIARAELVRHGYPVFGRAPREVFPAMSEADVREAARAELTGYWAWVVRRPWVWLDPVIADLGLTSMARARHTLATGELMTKTRAIESAGAPDWLIAQVRARRRGEAVTSPRVRTARIAWCDARRTVARADRR